MKFVIAAVCLVACVAAAPPQAVRDVVPIVHSEANVDYDGRYNYRYESGDGTKAEQTGELRVFDKDNAGVVSQGSFSYQGDDGKAYQLTYVADENGYQPQGEHLPVAPEVPAAILRALDYIAAHPYKEDKH